MLTNGLWRGAGQQQQEQQLQQQADRAAYELRMTCINTRRLPAGSLHA